jgi:hypothetical protein
MATQTFKIFPLFSSEGYYDIHLDYKTRLIIQRVLGSIQTCGTDIDNKFFGEELIASFPFILHGPHRKLKN